MLYGGDELENSQMGNNNAYCQDNEIGWIDWKKGRSYSQFTGFVKDLIRFRKDHPILHMPQELRPTDYKSLGWPEISYHSERAWFADTESSSRQIGILYCGGYAKEMTGKEDVFIYVIYNMHWNEHKFALPDIPEGMRWYLAIDSSKKNSVCERRGTAVGREEINLCKTADDTGIIRGCQRTGGKSLTQACRQEGFCLRTHQKCE